MIASNIEALDAEMVSLRRERKKELGKGFAFIAPAAVFEGLLRSTHWLSDTSAAIEFVPPLLAAWGLLRWGCALIYSRRLERWPRERAELIARSTQ